MNPQDLNRYSYVRNSPLNYTDPTGHCSSLSNVMSDPAACSHLLWIRLFGSLDPFMRSFDSSGSTNEAINAPVVPVTAPPLPVISPPLPPPSPPLDYVFGPGLSFGVGGPSRFIGTVQTGLDVASFIPVLNTPAGLANAGISAFRGHYGEAGLYALTALPVLGTIGKASHSAEGALQHLTNILKPGGKLIGEAGTTPGIRVLAGGKKAAEDLILDLGQAGRLGRDIKEGFLIRIDELGTLTYRYTSESGGPAIDVNIRGLSEVWRLHFK